MAPDELSQLINARKIVVRYRIITKVATVGVEFKITMFYNDIGWRFLRNS
jgi:hypothetical protein